MRQDRVPPQTIARSRPPRNPNFQYYFVAVLCCVILVAGFFFAARQHFSSIDHGIKNSRLRRQLDELQSERRRLLLAREISLTPAEIRKAAKRVGFVDTPIARSEPANDRSSTIQKTVVRSVEASAPSASPRPASKVVPTVISEPVIKPGKNEKQARRDGPATKKDRSKI